jgi:hypothetical protein
MADSEKMSALDLVIAVLREHEKTLDSLIEKLENTLKNVSTTQTQEKTKTVTSTKRTINFICEEWNEFKKICIGAESISFQWNHELKIKALQGNTIYEYKELIYKHAETMECGIPIKFQPNLDLYEVKRILSKELNVPENRIMRGEIQFTQ